MPKVAEPRGNALFQAAPSHARGTMDGEAAGDRIAAPFSCGLDGCAGPSAIGNAMATQRRVRAHWFALPNERVHPYFAPPIVAKGGQSHLGVAEWDASARRVGLASPASLVAQGRWSVSWARPTRAGPSASHVEVCKRSKRSGGSALTIARDSAAQERHAYFPVSGNAARATVMLT